MSRVTNEFGSNKLHTRAATAGLLLAAGMSLCLALVPRPAFAAQRTIEADMQRPIDAVNVTKIMLGKSELQCGLIASRTASQPITAFDGGDDWLQNITVYLLNRTNNSIVYAGIVLWFPDTWNGSPQHPILTFPISLGRVPDSVAFSGGTGQPLRQSPNARPIAFGSRQTLAIHLGDYIDRIRASVGGAIPLAAITKMIIRRETFYFSDGMKWNMSGFYTYDQASPRRWKALDETHLPSLASWPPAAN